MFTVETAISPSEKKGPMNPSPAEPELEKQPKSPMTAPLRFTYPSGSRPLDGYEIKRGVGRGGFGEVYFAVSDAGKEVALKLIRRNLDVEVRGVTQCLNLKHQNLVALYDIRDDEHEDRWVVMEYVSGESLEDAIDRHPGGMPIELAMDWFSGIAAGVAYLHDHGIVHRDLKPANIFIDEGIVKIGDYGLSKFISCSRRSGQTESVGTVHYMAPEIANGRYGKEIDTYALGIILYEMLTGRVPFEGESVGEVLMKHLTAEPDLSKLEDPYKELVRKAMTKDPDTRLQSVAEMLDRLPVGSTQPQQQRVRPTANAQPAMPTHAALGESTQPPPTSLDEEPIMASIQAGWRSLENHFHEANYHPLAKLAMLVLAIMFLGLTEVAWVPTLISLGFAYLVYRAIRAIVMPATSIDVPANSLASTTASPAPTEASAPRVPTPAEVATPPVRQTKRHYARRRRQNWQAQLNQYVASRPVRDRTTELLGSMLVSAAIASMLAIVGVAFVGEVFTWELYLWMSIVATVGSWAVMIPAKLSEGRVEDQSPLRFGLLISGAIVGMVACGVAQSLMLEIPVSSEVMIGPWDALAGQFFQGNVYKGDLSEAFRGGSVPVNLSMATAYFAFLFVVLRWWRQAEYARPDRVSVWSIIACTSAAFLMTFIWWFPQPAGAVLAGIIAFTTQLSSPWMPPSKRRQVAEQGVV